jgi:putative membrane protein insertion efficiency factor
VNAGRDILIFLVRIYRALVSPVLSLIFGSSGLGCRFTPTCSEYALEALKTHGAAKGACLTAHRLCRCHPWGGRGYDPVPKQGWKLYTGGRFQAPGAHH